MYLLDTRKNVLQLCFNQNIALISLLLMMKMSGYGILGARNVCFRDNQPNCNENFVDVYRNLSKSANNRKDADTYFWMFTRKNPDDPESLHRCGGKLPPDTNFDPQNELIVIINPFLYGICDFHLHLEWIDEILKKGEYNIMAVDWSWGNGFPFLTAVKNLKVVAKQTVEVLKNIQRDTGISKDKITLVGISLGAQAAGLIGKDFPVSRIIGLDPAGPLFGKNKPLDSRLDPSDADFVEAWHCNAGERLPKLGINYDAGDVDYWIDGGILQNSCKDNNGVHYFSVNSSFTFAGPESCSHLYCAQYFKESINAGQNQFVGVKCDSYEQFQDGKCKSCGEERENCFVMGFDALKYAKNNLESPQVYYVQTNSSLPHCDNSNIDLQGFLSTE